MDTWQDWHDWWVDIVTDVSNSSNNINAQSSLDELFWQLQEYRISLFATDVKTKGSISSKKLQKSFDQLETLVSE